MGRSLPPSLSFPVSPSFPFPQFPSPLSSVSQPAFKFPRRHAACQNVGQRGVQEVRARWRRTRKTSGNLCRRNCKRGPRFSPCCQSPACSALSVSLPTISTRHARAPVIALLASALALGLHVTQPPMRRDARVWDSSRRIATRTAERTSNRPQHWQRLRRRRRLCACVAAANTTTCGVDNPRG